jgi:hypothetical protein
MFSATRKPSVRAVKERNRHYKRLTIRFKFPFEWIKCSLKLLYYYLNDRQSI